MGKDRRLATLKEYKWYIGGVLLMVALYFLRYWIAYILFLLSLGIFSL